MIDLILLPTRFYYRLDLIFVIDSILLPTRFYYQLDLIASILLSTQHYHRLDLTFTSALNPWTSYTTRIEGVTGLMEEDESN